MKFRRDLYRAIFLLLTFGLLNYSVLGQSEVIQVGADNSYYPFEFLNEENQAVGFDIDLLQELAKVKGIKLQITSGNWFIIKDQMETGKFDMLAGMYYNPDRAEQFDFSMPYIIITHSLFVKDGNTIASLDELREDKSIRVVIENSSILQNYLTTNGIMPERILSVENQLDALLMLEDSYTTCALLPELQAKNIAKNNGLNDIKSIGYPILPREYSFVVIKGDTAMLNILNEGLTSLHQSGTYKIIFEKWFGMYNPAYSVLEERTSIFWLVGLSLLLIFLFIYFFMKYSMKRIVSENKKIHEELKQTNQTLKDVYKKETLLKRIIEFSPFPIVLINEKSNFEFTNSGFENLFGKQLNSNDSFNHWIKNNIKKKHEQNFIKSQLFHNPKDTISQKSSNSIFSLTTKNGEEIMMNLFFVSISKDQLLIFFCDCIEISKNAMQKEISEAKKEDNKPLFLPRFAHEVRSPMNIILGFSEMMSYEELSVEELKAYSSHIFKNGQKLHQILGNIGALSELESNETQIITEPIVVFDLINGISKDFNSIYLDDLKDFEMRFKCIDDIDMELLVNSDHKILVQILNNLFLYLLDFNNIGKINVGAKLAKNNQVEIFFDAELQEEDFNSFSRKAIDFMKDPKNTSSFFNSAANLSLYLSFIFIKLLGSSFSLTRGEKNWVQFAFALPTFKINDLKDAEKNNKILIRKKHFNWEDKKILIADDNLESTDYFKFIFRATKANIITVKNGQEAYEQCRINPEIDLVIMDWLMPVMDGETSTKLIKQLEPTLPIIAVTASDHGNEQSKILLSGCNAYYTKPVERSEFLNYIDSIFEG